MSATGSENRVYNKTCDAIVYLTTSDMIGTEYCSIWCPYTYTTYSFVAEPWTLLRSGLSRRVDNRVLNSKSEIHCNGQQNTMPELLIRQVFEITAKSARLEW